jgi:cobalt-zinc-cadmium efflux system protein
MNSERRLAVTFFVTLLVLTGELVGGYLSNSLALLSDAGHMVTDAFAIALGFVAARISRRPSDKHATFGYQRVGLLAALINGLSLLLIALLIFYEAYQRIVSPPEIKIPVLLGIAVLGLIGNLGMAFILGHSHDDLNIKGVWLHILGDTLSSVGWTYTDAIASGLIWCVIIWGGIRLVSNTVPIFLNLTPKGFNVEVLIKEITDMHDVIDVHDVHLWPVAHNRVAFSAHVLVDDKTLKEAEVTKKNIEGILRKNGIDHSTLQIECASTNCSNNLFCQGGTEHEDEASHR